MINYNQLMQNLEHGSLQFKKFEKSHLKLLINKNEIPEK